MLLYPSVLLDKLLLGGHGIMGQSLNFYDEVAERLLMRNKRYEMNVPAFNMGRCVGDIVSMTAGVIGTGYGAYIATMGMIGGIGGTAVDGGAAAFVVGSAAGVGVLIAVGGIHLSAQASVNKKRIWTSIGNAD